MSRILISIGYNTNVKVDTGKEDEQMKNFVNYEWLMENLNNEKLIILDVRQGTEELAGIQIYKEEHIKGAQYVSFHKVMVGKLSKYGGRSPLPKLETFIENIKEFGISDDSIIVIYGDPNIEVAGRLWWMLKYIGKDNVFILDGGYSKWKKNNGEITTVIPEVERSDSLSLNIKDKLYVDMEGVKRVINSESSAIVDSRAYERYTGEVEPLDRIPGHIPSALNYPWMDLIKDGEIISLDEARQHFKDLKDYEEIIVHCGSGITATVNILLMEEIGLKPKHYAGGYSDWVSYEDNEVDVGERT